MLRLYRQLYLLGVMNPLNRWSSAMLYSNTIVNCNRPEATIENFTFVSFCISSDIIKKGKTQTTKWKAKTINHNFIDNLYLELKKKTLHQCCLKFLNTHTHTHIWQKKHINGHWETCRCATSLVISEIKSKSKWENILIYQNKTIKRQLCHTMLVRL